MAFVFSLSGNRAYGQYSEVAAPHIDVALVSKATHIAPGINYLAVRLQAEAGWHTYWKNPGDTGYPTRLVWQLPESFSAGDIQWPVPERIQYQDLINYGYHGDTWLVVPVHAPDNLSGDSVDISVIAKWLICKEVCIPGEAQLTLSLPVLNNQANTYSQWASYFDWAESRTPTSMRIDGAAFEAASGNISFRLPLEQLPVITQQPAFFVTEKGVVQHTALPVFSTVFDEPSQQSQLIIDFTQDQYLTSAPDELGLVIVASSSGNITKPVSAVELSVEKTLVPGAKKLESSYKAPHKGALESSSNSLKQLGIAIVFALLGGLILNAMPCVFPVLSLKIVSLIESGHHSPRERKQHGLAYTSGVVLSFILVAWALILFRTAGEQIGWGFQLQSPMFIAVLVYILSVLGLSLSGFIELGSSLQNIGADLGRRNGLQGSFFTGVLATIVATPCTAPFMGAAMGYALSQPAWMALLVFAVMGLGLALPFLLIAYIPLLANCLPKPGNWMVRLKEFLAFPIYLTVVWLLWVFSRQTGSNALAILLIGVLVLVFALWLWRLSVYRDQAAMTKSMAILSVMIALAIIPIAINAKSNTESTALENPDTKQGLVGEKFSMKKIQAALDQGRPVFVNMTADWCITCKVNEKVAFQNTRVIEAFAKSNTLYLVGDWTNSDALISQYLEQFNRNGVPLYVYYRPDQEPIVLPQILTPSQVATLVLD